MRIVIGEDEALLREGLRLVLETDGTSVVGVAESATELVVVTEACEPDLVITDIRMPPGHGDDGLRAAIELRQRHPTLAVVLLSQHVQRTYAMELFEQRPDRVGYLLKQRIADIATFRADLRRVVDGGTVLDPEVAAAMVARAARTDGLDRLTPRQLDVLRLITEGRSNAAVARALAISEKTVVHHTSQIYDQLGLEPNDDDHRRVLAVIRYLEGC